jgi:SAM-dependent methyltransferase
MAQRPWYAEWFGADYLRLYPHRNLEEARRQIEFLARVLPIGSGERILDLACGDGRHLTALSRAGHRPVGADLSAYLLRRATRLLRLRGQSARLVRCHMLRLPFAPGSFELVLSLFTSFGYFDNEAQERQVLGQVRELIGRRGRLVLDVLNRPYVLEHLVAEDITRRGAVVIHQRRRYDREGRRVIKEIRILEGSRERRFSESVRAFDRLELIDLLRSEGLKVVRAFGEFDGRALSDATPRMILVARPDAAA